MPSKFDEEVKIIHKKCENEMHIVHAWSMPSGCSCCDDKVTIEFHCPTCKVDIEWVG